MYRAIPATLALAAALAAAPFAAHAQQVKLGAVMPLTGDLQDFGNSDLEGVRLAVQEINAQGGVLGGEVDLAVADTRTSPQAGVDAARKLVNVENVAGLVGALSSGVTIPIGRSVAAEEGVPQVSNASTSPVITNLDDDGYLFRTVPSDSLQGVVLGDIVHGEGVRKVSTLYVNNDYGEGLANVFERQFEKLGGEVVSNQPYEKGKASYRGELASAAEGGAEALLLIAYPENGITIIRQSLEGGYFDRFVFTDGMKTPKVVEQIGGEHLANSIGSTPTSVESAGADHFEQAYEAQFGQLPPKPFIDTAYDATYLLALAIEKAGSTDGAEVRDALHDVSSAPGTKVTAGEWSRARELIASGEAIDYQGAAGPHDFDENGDVPGVIEQWTFTEDGGVETLRKLGS